MKRVACVTILASHLLLAPSASPAGSLREHLEFLAADALAGRGGGQEGERVAAGYIAGAMAASGLRPAGPDGYWQPFEFEAVAPASGASTLVSQNVLGLLQGDDPSEIVMVGAHYDGMGAPGEADPGRQRRPEDAGDDIWNGANDNASSIALMLEVAERLRAAGRRPSRSVLFVAFGAEEHGLTGSIAFVNRPPVELGRIVAFINLEQVGSRPGEELISAATGTSPMWEPALEAANRRVGAETTVAIDVLIADTDHYAPALVGIPSITVGHGDGPEGHTPGDDLSVIDFPSMERRVGYVEALIDVVAGWPGRPAWTVEPEHYLGLSAGEASAEERAAAGLEDDRGALKVVAVIEGGTGDRAGLRVGDVVVEIDGESLPLDAYGTSLNERMLDLEVGQELTLGRQRGAVRDVVRVCKGSCAPSR